MNSEILLEHLQKHFALPQFRKGQVEIIQAALNKQDVLAVLPTGGGKSLCYQFPAVYLQKLVIVVSPLIALMKDQVLSLKRFGVPAGALYSGQTLDEKRQVFGEIRKGGTFVLFLSPERAATEGFQTWIKSQPIALFAIDEAHCVSQWGHDFRSEYAQLKILKSLRPDVPVLALTASATPVVLSDIAKSLCLHKPARMVHGFYRPNLYYQVEFCQGDDEKDALLHQAIEQFPQGRVLVYCGTRASTEDIRDRLSRKFASVDGYHAGMSTKERTRIQESYVNGEIRILVATNAFGMGIDQPDVRLVVHYQMPANIDSLYQEMGRAGRDGQDSTCLMLYAKKDKGLQSFFITSSEAEAWVKQIRWRTLEALVSYCEGGECRHSEILTYYKDSQRIQNCGHCDQCLPQSDRRVVRPVMVTIEKTKAPKTKRRSVKPETVMLDAIQESRFNQLRRWRKAKAIELDSPAFVVCSDRTLREIAAQNPQCLDDLRRIHGIGEQKLETFGYDILAELSGEIS